MLRLARRVVNVSRLVYLLVTDCSDPLVLRFVSDLICSSIGVLLFRVVRRWVVNPKSRRGMIWLLRLVASIRAVGQVMLLCMPRSGEHVRVVVNFLVELGLLQLST